MPSLGSDHHVLIVGSGPVIELTHMPPVTLVGGRLLGRFWYNTEFGGR